MQKKNSGAGKIGQLHVKKMRLEHSVTLYTKNKKNSKWNRPKCKIGNCKTPRRRHVWAYSFT